MTQLNLEAIEVRCEALDEQMGKMAWTLEGPNYYGLLVFAIYGGDGNVVCRSVKEQQDFIAHARADIPALVAEIKRLRGEVYRLRAEVAHLFHGDEGDDEEE